MSGFSSLLNQFKQTTQQATSLSNTHQSSRAGQSASTTSLSNDTTNKKRTRSIFETTTTSNQGTKSSNNTTTTSQQQSKQYKYPTKPIKTIYIACPAYTETGGPEALHQLCHMINVGEYAYEVDDDDVKEEKITKCDEFGRALFTDKKPSTTVTSKANSTATSNTIKTTKTTE